MQESGSYADYLSKVLAYDKARAPSGEAVWWPEVYPSPQNRSRTTGGVRALTFDTKVAGAVAPDVVAPDVGAHINGISIDELR